MSGKISFGDMMKNVMSDSQLLEWCARIYKNNE